VIWTKEKEGNSHKGEIMKKIIIFPIIFLLAFCSGTSIKKITYHVEARAMSSQHGFSEVNVLITYKDDSVEMVSLTHNCRRRGFSKEITVSKNFLYNIKAQVKADFPCELDVIIYEGNTYSGKKISSQRKQGLNPEIRLVGTL